MSRTTAATARTRLVLTVVVGAAVAVLMPWLLAPVADAPSLLLLTSFALTALTGLHARTGVRAAGVQAPRRASAEAGGVVLRAGRVTDAPHHPLRPRAPGLV